VSSRELTSKQTAKLMELIVKRLRTVELEAPQAGEREPEYTARCLYGPVRDALTKLGIHGLIEAGDGGPTAQPVPLLGLLFYPDLIVRYHGAPTLAIEVKYLGTGSRGNSVATALGQAYLYRRAGYKQTGAFLIDRANKVTDAQIKQAEDVCKSAEIDVIVRRVAGKSLVAHPL
jgi:hypothetical protein